MSNYNFPLLTSAELATSLHEILDDTFSEDDFKNPQATRIQNLYAMLLHNVSGTQVDRINQSQLQAAQVVTHPELYDEIHPLINLALVLQRFMVACTVKDFRLKDFMNPKPKRTRRFLSAIINFWRFSVEREQVYENIVQEIEGSIAERRTRLAHINQLKEKINLIKMSRAEEEVHINQLQGSIDELDGKMMSQQQEQAVLQREIGHLKTSLAEKVALQEKQKISILNKQEVVSKMRAQVVQSPERMKADISRMHSSLAACKETKKEKAKRLQELRSQNDNGQVHLQSSEQGVSMISAINTELEKQREAQAELERVRDQIQGQKDHLRDLTAQEGHLNRQRDSKQEKLVKLQLQHQRTTTALKENTQTANSELETYYQKQEKKLGHVCVLNEQKNAIKKQMSDKENIHEEEMKQLRGKYDQMLVSLDAYHKDLAVGWEQADPHPVLDALNVA